MVLDLRVDATPGLVVLGWRAREDGLHLTVRNHSDEVRLVCKCGRFHWIVRERFSGGTASFLVTCHNCGTRGSFVMEGVSLPSP